MNKVPIEQVVTYYAVIHGDPGNQTFSAHRTEPGISTVAFRYEGPVFGTEQELQADFNARFLPLRLIGLRASGEHESCGCVSGRTAFAEGMLLGATLKSSGEYRSVTLTTRDGRQLMAL